MNSAELRPLALALALIACSNTSATTPAPSVPTSGSAALVESVPAADAGASGGGGAAVDGGAAGDGGALSDDVARHYQAALTAYGRDDFQTAAREFEAAFRAHPNAELAFNAGRMYERMASVAEATRWYEQVLAMSPDANRRADVTQRLASLRDYERRRREDIAQPPPGADALQHEAASWFARGINLYRRRRYAEALRAFEAAQQFTEGAGRTPPELMYNLAVTHEHLGHAQEAIGAFRAYLSLRPDSADHEAVERRIHALQPR